MLITVAKAAVLRRQLPRPRELIAALHTSLASLASSGVSITGPVCSKHTDTAVFHVAEQNGLIEDAADAPLSASLCVFAAVTKKNSEALIASH